jgi:hypothetical protein
MIQQQTHQIPIDVRGLVGAPEDVPPIDVADRSHIEQ